LSGLELAAAFLAAGMGGVVGAISAVLLAGANATATYEAFSADFKTYMGGRNDPASQALADSFGDMEAGIGVLLGALGKLKRAFRRK
jgi:hypothetical protein